MGLRDDRALAELGERCGGVFSLPPIPVLGWFIGVTDPGLLERVVVVTDPDLVKQLYTAKSSVVSSVDGNRPTELAYGPHSLFLLDGPPHHRLRRILTPPFRGEALESHRDTMRAVIERAVAELVPGQPFRLLELLHDATAEIIVRICMGIEDEDRLAEWRPAMQAFAQVPSSTGSLVRHLLKPVGGLRWWPSFERVRAGADALLYGEIARRRKAGGLEQADDVLAVLLRSRTEDGEALSDVEIRDQLVTLLLAGHETTATTGAWALERVVRHPEVLARLAAEALNGDSDEYAKAVTNETLRIRPPVIGIARRTVARFELGEHVLAPGTWVVTPFRAIHRNPKLYPQPDAFRPERFLEQAPPQFGWVPFGGGPHKCLGMHFAQLELTVVMHTLLRELTLSPADRRDEAVMVRSITLIPKHHTTLIGVPRRDVPAPEASPPSPDLARCPVHD